MRRKNRTNKRMLQIPKKYFDKLFYMNMLFKRIFLKKYKSANRRLVISNFIFLKFFLMDLKTRLYLNFFRKSIQYSFLSRIYFSGFFMIKRLFNYRIFFENFLEKSKYKYLYMNNPYGKYFVASARFNKILYCGGEKNGNLILSDNFVYSEEARTNGALISTNFVYSNESDLSFFLTFNLHLLIIVELYKIIILLFLKKIIINFFKKI